MKNRIKILIAPLLIILAGIGFFYLTTYLSSNSVREFLSNEDTKIISSNYSFANNPNVVSSILDTVILKNNDNSFDTMIFEKNKNISNSHVLGTFKDSDNITYRYRNGSLINYDNYMFVKNFDSAQECHNYLISETNRYSKRFNENFFYFKNEATKINDSLYYLKKTNYFSYNTPHITFKCDDTYYKKLYSFYSLK